MNQITLKAEEKDLGEFTVRRLLPSIQRKMVGPWIFFDHMGPVSFLPGQGANVRPHPHINLATVTYLFEGEMFHRDSLGHTQTIHPGDINLMVAGCGIVHSERERSEVHNINHTLHGLQLWHALPEEYEEINPAFYHHKAEDLPQTTVDGVVIRVMMGKAYGLHSPVKTFIETIYVEAFLRPGQKLTLPNTQELGIYVVSGSLKIKDTLITAYQMYILTDDNDVIIETDSDTRVAIIGGKPLGKRFIEWNFVSSRKERIEEAKQAWKNKEYPTIPGDDVEFIPLPE